MKNGADSAPALNATPAIAGEMALVVVRATLVIPAVAVRSSGSTTAIVYDCRVGTSICEMLIRARKNATASRDVGASGTSISSRFDGRCENTIVFSRPKRSANQPAASSDAPERMPTQKKMTARSATGRPHRRKNQYDTIDWTTSAPANASRPKSAESFATVPAL